MVIGLEFEIETDGTPACERTIGLTCIPGVRVMRFVGRIGITVEIDSLPNDSDDRGDFLISSRLAGNCIPKYGTEEVFFFRFFLVFFLTVLPFIDADKFWTVTARA